MKQWWLFLVLGFLSAGPALGGDCSPVDVRPLIGAPFDQGDSGYCFAHTAASLVQAKTGFRASPMHLASVYILTNAEELMGAAPPEVRERVTPANLEFWRNDLRSSAGQFTPDKILGEDGLLDTGGEELPTLLAANFRGLCSEIRLPSGADVYKKYLASINVFHRARAERGIPPEETQRPLGEVHDPVARGMAWSWRHWVNERCGSPVLPARPLLPAQTSLAPSLEAFRKLQASLAAGDTFKARNKVFRAIDAQLDRGQPISIGYALADLMPSKASSAVPAEMDHASIIAARKMVGGRCHYFVRNSFGTDLDGYAPRFRGRLESGGVWVLPEEIPSLYMVVWLD